MGTRKVRVPGRGFSSGAATRAPLPMSERDPDPSSKKEPPPEKDVDNSVKPECRIGTPEGRR